MSIQSIGSKMLKSNGSRPSKSCIAAPTTASAASEKLNSPAVSSRPGSMAKSNRSSCTDAASGALAVATATARSEEHTSELQSLMRISYAVFCLKKKKITYTIHTTYLTVIHISHLNHYMQTILETFIK